jgi:hypothetical protein
MAATPPNSPKGSPSSANGWPATPPRLGTSLEDFVGNPAYGILDRFVFLLGGSDGEQFLSSDHDEPAEGGTNGN